MAKIEAFRALRPRVDVAVEVASPPYDVLNSAEARAMAEGNPISFLHVNKPEILQRMAEVIFIAILNGSFCGASFVAIDSFGGIYLNPNQLRNQIIGQKLLIPAMISMMPMNQGKNQSSSTSYSCTAT